MKLILASASPRRREILARIAYPFDVRPADLDETRRPGESPHDYVARLGREKAEAIARHEPDAFVVAADTTVARGDTIYGKPRDREDAARILSELADRTHHVLTGVAIARGGEVRQHFVTKSEVLFGPLSREQIAGYVATEEPLDKAGAYAVQGAAGPFLTGLLGSITNVIGLPLEETESALHAAGWNEVVGPLDDEAIALRFRSVRGEIAGRAVASGRRADAVRLLTVTKGQPAELAAAAIAAGATDVGENYVQEAEAKRDAIGAAPARWHLIGPLQRNKAAAAARTFEVVHTISRVETAAALARRHDPSTPPREVLLQVNVDQDDAKAGASAREVRPLLDQLRELAALRVTGLMTIGRAGASRDAAAETFASLRKLRDDLRDAGYDSVRDLSMGMSGDYDVAIEQGATIVRLGTAILGPRRPRGEG